VNEKEQKKIIGRTMDCSTRKGEKVKGIRIEVRKQ
jgi:hypothetical protein